VKRLLIVILSGIFILGLIVAGCSTPQTTTVTQTATVTASSTATTPATTTPTTTTPTTTAAPLTYKVGAMLDLSGSISVYHIPQKLEMEHLQDIYNERGGITIQGQRYNIELIYADGTSTPDGAARSAAKLVYDDKVKFVIGPYGAESSACTPIFQANGVVDLNAYPMFTPGEVGPNTPYSFAGSYGQMGSFSVTIQSLVKLYPNNKKIFNMIEESSSLDAQAKFVETMEKAAGYTVMGTVGVAISSNDLTAYADKAIASGADVAAQFGGSLSTSGSFIKRLRSLDNEMPYGYSSVVGVKYIQDLLGAEATNFVATGYIVDSPLNPEIIKELQSRLPNGVNVNVGSGSPNCFTVWMGVIQAANSFDKDVFKDTWENKLTSVQGMFGEEFFCGTELYGRKHAGISHGTPAVHLDGVGNVVDDGWIDAGIFP